MTQYAFHPWIDLTFHEPVTQRIDWPGKLLQESLFSSQRFRPGQRNWLKPYTLNDWVVGSIPTRCINAWRSNTYTNGVGNSSIRLFGAVGYGTGAVKHKGERLLVAIHRAS